MKLPVYKLFGIILLMAGCSSSYKNVLDTWQICDTTTSCSEWKNINNTTHKRGYPASFQLKANLPEKSQSVSFVTNARSITVADQNGLLYEKKYDRETSDLHTISLPLTAKILLVNVEQDEFNPYDIGNYSYASSDSKRELLQQIINLGFIGSFLLLMGLYSIVFALRSARPDVLYFGYFSFFAGMNALANSPLSHYLWFIHNFSVYPKFRFVSFYGGNVFLFLFIEKMLGKGPYKFLYKFNLIMIALSSVFFVITVFYQELSVKLNILYLPVTLMGGVLVLLWIARLALQKNKEAIIIFAGGMSLIFLQFGVYLYNLGYLSWLISFDWAIFAFVVSLGTLLVRRSFLLKIKLEELARELTMKNSALVKSAQEKERLLLMEKEMDMAKKIQFSILPEKKPQTKLMQTAMRYIPAESVGGDFFDFLEKDGKIGLLVTDVSGHGFSSALIASMIKISFHASHEYWEQPGQMLNEINLLLHDKLKHNFLTAVYATIDPLNKRLMLANAGHPPLFVHKRKTTNEVLSFNSPGRIIGYDLQKKYGTAEVEIASGDRLLFLTDGILECENPERVPFEEDRLFDFFLANAGLNAEEFSDMLIAHLRNWSGKDLFADDVTLVLIDIM